MIPRNLNRILRKLHNKFKKALLNWTFIILKFWPLRVPIFWKSPGVRSASKYIHEWDNTCVSETERHGGARRCRIRNWNVAREWCGSPGVAPEEKASPGNVRAKWGTEKMWPACEISVPRYSVDIYRRARDQRGDTVVPVGDSFTYW